MTNRVIVFSGKVGEFRQWLKTSEMLGEFIARRSEHRCPFCGAPIDPNCFRDELSKREFEISGLCQSCQDEMFGV